MYGMPLHLVVYLGKKPTKLNHTILEVAQVLHAGLLHKYVVIC